MTMPNIPNSELSTTQVILIALSDLRDPDWNPRDFFDEEEMQSLMDFIQAGGRIEPIVIWTPSPENAEDEPIGPPWAIISGKRRREAYRRLGRTHIEAIPLDIPLREAMFMAIAANRDDKPFWLGEYKRVENLIKRYGELKQVEIKAKTGWSKTRVSQAIALTNLLNPASRELISQSRPKKVSTANFSEDEKGQDSGNAGKWRLPERPACELIPLWDKDNPEASRTKAEQAVRKIVDLQLTRSQIQELVSHTLAGNDPAQFETATRVRKQRSDSPKAKTSTHPAHAPASTAPSANGHHHEPLAQPSHAAQANSSAESAQYNHGPQQIVSAKEHAQQAPPDQPGDNWFWKMMVGIKFFNQLRSKVKKGEPLTGWEKCFVWGHAALKGLGKVLKFLKELFKPLAKTIGHAAKKALGDTLSGILVFLFRVALICLLVWAVIKVIDYGLVYPWHWVERKAAWALDGGLWSPKSVTPVPTPVSTPPPVVPQAVRSSKLESAKLKTKTSNSTSVAVYQPSITFNTAASPSDSSGVLTTLYDPKLLEQEIAALPQNCIVTAFPVLPDEGIPGDLAVTRLQDLMDPDKYTLMIGSGKYKIMNISATTTGLMINYQNTDIIDVFNHGGTATYVWEDMLYIHTDEIEQVRSSELGSSQLKTSNSSLLTSSPDNVIYHCTVIGAGAKNALTFRCGRADDLKHLVSALEYFIRNSRLGHDTALAGMPYPSQGVWLDNHWIVKLWAGSPIDKAGARLNDLVWSMDKDTQSPQDDKKLKSRLDVLTSGAYPLFIYSPGAGDNLGIDRNEFHTGNFSPRRRKIIFSVP